MDAPDTAGLASLVTEAVVGVRFVTFRVKVCVAAVPKPLLAVMVNT